MESTEVCAQGPSTVAADVGADLGHPSAAPAAGGPRRVTQRLRSPPLLGADTVGGSSIAGLSALGTDAPHTRVSVASAQEPALPSAAASRADGEWVRLLDADPDLGDGLDPEVFSRARRLLCAPVVTLEPNSAGPPDCEPRTTFGLLVLSGLMGRRVRIGQAHATELLGPGDILRPWDEHELLQSVPPEVDWRVFKPVRLAVLDEEVTRLIGRRPELVIAFSGRLLNRARAGSYLRAVSHLSRVDEKLLITLWHLASRWGHVTPAGVVVPFRLTHEVIGEILGAQRPSVTLAVKRLRCNGIVERGADGRLILLGAPGNRTSVQAHRATPSPHGVTGVH